MHPVPDGPVPEGPVPGGPVLGGRALKAPTLRLRSPSEVVEAVPYLLGFHPSDSVVFLSLRASRLGLCVRADLPDPDEADALVSYTVSKLRDDGATAVVLVVYGPDAGAPGVRRPSRRDLVEVCSRVLAASGVQVRDALQVADGRWWSYLCDDAHCCPPEGSPLPVPGDGESAAAWALAGRAVLPDRATVLAALEPPTGARAQRLRRVVRRVRAEMLESQAGLGAAAWESSALEQLRRAVECFEHPRGSVDDERAVRLALALEQTAVRDEVLLWAGGSRREALARLLRDVLARVPPPADAAAATTYAWVAYQAGDGVLARGALERALASDPGHGLGVLLSEALDDGVHPGVLAEVGVRARLDRHRRRADADPPEATT